MYKLMMLIIVCVSLGACSPLTPIADAILPGNEPAVEVDTQIGKENTKQIVGVQEEVTNSAQGDIVTVNNASTPVWVWMLAIIGWMAPSPSTIWKELKELWSDD